MTIRYTYIRTLNYPPNILRQEPTSINKRISTLSSETFQDVAPTHQNALAHSNFRDKLEYMPHATQQPGRNNQRNIIWFNPADYACPLQNKCISKDIVYQATIKTSNTKRHEALHIL